MKLYVYNGNEKVYLNLKANTRQALANQIGGYSFYLGNTLYSVNKVYAEKDSNNTATGAVVGGTIGALAGPAGIFFGGLIGSLIGNTSDDEENRLVNNFNQS